MTAPPSPEEAERLAKTRFAIINAAKASGVVLMLFGMWIWFGDLVQHGGYPPLGLPIFVIGLLESLILPRILVARWRSPR